jgi:hypothetical protein
MVYGHSNTNNLRDHRTSNSTATERPQKRMVYGTVTQTLADSHLSPRYSSISAHGSRRNILRWLEPTNPTNSKLCSSLNNTDDTAGAFRAVLVGQSVVGFPSRVSKSRANADGSRRYNTSIAIGTLPSVGGQTGHDVCAAAGLPAKGG